MENSTGAKRITIISGDSHIGASAEVYRTYLDPKYREVFDELHAKESPMRRVSMEMSRRCAEADIPAVGDRGQASAERMFPLYLDLDTRLAEMDADGIVAEVTMIGAEGTSPTPFFSEFNYPYPPDVRVAGLRAHHRWLADMGAQAKGRLILIGESGPCLDMKAEIAELEWLAEHGFSAVGLPHLVYDPELPPLAGDYFDSFWSACEDLGLALYTHAGWGEPQGKVLAMFEHAASGALSQSEIESMLDGSNPMSTFALRLWNRRSVWQLMLGGVFDRHPKLKVGLIELRSDWIPPTLAYFDKRMREDAPHLKLSAREYWRQNCFVTPSSPRPVEIAQRDEIGVETILFGTDYPHPEGTWPNTRQWLQNTFKGVPEADARKILGENAIRIYGLDAAKMDAIAARIGPTPAEVLGAGEVDPKLLHAFNRRSGYLQPAATPTPGMLDEFFDSLRSDAAA